MFPDDVKKSTKHFHPDADRHSAIHTVSIKTAKLGDQPEPVAPRAFKGIRKGTFTNTERRVQRVRKAVEPPGEVAPNWRILCDIATRMGYEMKYPSAEAVFDEIAAVTPSCAGMDYQRLKLTIAALDPVAKIPEYKVCAVKLEKVA